MNKTDLIQKIQSLDALTNDEKAGLLALLRQSKKYGLVWEEKPEAVETRLQTELPVLVEFNKETHYQDRELGASVWSKV